MTSIIVDNREPKELYEYLRKKFKDITFTYKKIKSGDYVSKTVICERKTVSDLYGSILDKRIWSQVNRISQYDSCIPVLLVTGDLDKFIKYMMGKRKKFINSKLFYSTIADISLRYGFHVIWTPDDQTGLDVLISFIEHCDAGNYKVPTKADKNILAARLLGITIRQWNEVKQLGSITEIAKKKPQDLMEIKGIGKVKAKTILETLNKQEWMVSARTGKR